VKGDILSNKAGLFVHPESVNEMVSAISWLRNNSDDLSEMGKQAKIAVKRDFERATIAKYLSSYCESVI
jgi:hypothetical protein